MKGWVEVRAAGRDIAMLASTGLYRTDRHVVVALGQTVPGRDAQEVVAAHPAGQDRSSAPGRHRRAPGRGVE